MNHKTINSKTAAQKPQVRTNNSKHKPSHHAKAQTSRKPQKPKANTLRIIPLGGNEEVGRNMTLFEYNDDIVILDMGLMFPEESMPGIDYIVPNVDYLKGKEKNVKAVIFSHGHLDHIGAAPILLEKLGYPTIIGRPLTLAMVRHRQEDYKKNTSKNLKAITIKNITDTFKFGAFKLKLFQVEHSIMDAVGVILETPSGSILHPGDWTLEKDNKGKPVLNYSHLANVKRPAILMLESLGATDVRHSASEEQMHNNLSKIIKESPGRLIIGTFASQIERINWVIKEAESMGKKIALDGYSMKVNIEIAQKFGYVKAKKGTLININEIDDYPDTKVVVLATGAQGESNAVLSRIITGSHRTLKIKKTDTVVLSSSIIPGNENSIQRLKDGLYRQTDHVIHGEIMDIHVSGHGNRDDIKYILNAVKPDYFLPVYAYHYMLKESAQLARAAGFKDKQVIVLDNGQVAEFDKAGGRKTNERVPTDHVFVDGLGVGDISRVVLRDRQMMADDGMIVVIATINTKKRALTQNPDLISRGFIYMKENKKLIEETRNRVKKIFDKMEDPIDDDYFKNKIRNEVGQFLYKKTERRPMVLPVIIKV